MMHYRLLCESYGFLYYVGDTYQVIYGRSSGPKYVREAWATVLYHNRSGSHDIM